MLVGQDEVGQRNRVPQGKKGGCLLRLTGLRGRACSDFTALGVGFAVHNTMVYVQKQIFNLGSAGAKGR